MWNNIHHPTRTLYPGIYGKGLNTLVYCLLFVHRFGPEFLLFVVFYTNVLNNFANILLSALKATNEFSFGYTIFVVDQSLKVFLSLLIENFGRATTSLLMIRRFSRLIAINFIINGRFWFSFANKMVKSELFSNFFITLWWKMVLILKPIDWKLFSVRKRIGHYDPFRYQC